MSHNDEVDQEIEIPLLGSASVEDEPEKVPDLSRIGRAHYTGMNELRAAQVFHEECLCVTCFLSPMCRVAAGINESLTVITRCLAYLPSDPS